MSLRQRPGFVLKAPDGMGDVISLGYLQFKTWKTGSQSFSFSFLQNSKKANERGRI
jgi:hypothetical protein